MDKKERIAIIKGKFKIIAIIINSIFTILGMTIGFIINNYYQVQKSNQEKVERDNRIIEIERNYDDLLNKFEALENEYNYLISNKNSSPINYVADISEVDQIEIDQIIIRIQDFIDYDKYNEFTNFKIDIYEIELLYKLFLSEEYFKYENIIYAFNQYGINCDELSINQNLLELWDIEILYTYYNMYNNIEKDDIKFYPFNTYKMIEIDDFDYSVHGMNYENDSYDFIYKDLERRINKIIRKMNRNSLQIVRYITLKVV